MRRRLPRDDCQRHGTRHVLERLKDRLKGGLRLRQAPTNPAGFHGSLQRQCLGGGKPCTKRVKPLQSRHQLMHSLGSRRIQCDQRPVERFAKPRLLCDD